MIDFRFHVSDLTEKSVRPECQSSLKIEALRVVVGLSECRINVCIIASSISRNFQAPSLWSVQERPEEPIHVLKQCQRDASYDYTKDSRPEESFHGKFRSDHKYGSLSTSRIPKIDFTKNVSDRITVCGNLKNFPPRFF